MTSKCLVMTTEQEERKEELRRLLERCARAALVISGVAATVYFVPDGTFVVKEHHRPSKQEMANIACIDSQKPENRKGMTSMFSDGGAVFEELARPMDFGKKKDVSVTLPPT